MRRECVFFFAKMFETYHPLSKPGRQILFFLTKVIDVWKIVQIVIKQDSFQKITHTHTQWFCNKSDHASTSVNNGCGSSQNAEYNTDERLFT